MPEQPTYQLHLDDQSVRLVEKCAYHCPHCGATDCYEDVGAGDYYQGHDYYCSACFFNWTMPSEQQLVFSITSAALSVDPQMSKI